MSALLGFGQMSPFFLTGAAENLLAWGLLTESARLEIAWGGWFLAALPLALVTFGLAFATTMLLFPPEFQPTISRGLIHTQIEALGPLSRAEIINAGVVIGLRRAIHPAEFSVGLAVDGDDCPHRRQRRGSAAGVALGDLHERGDLVSALPEHVLLGALFRHEGEGILARPSPTVGVGLRGDLSAGRTRGDSVLAVDGVDSVNMRCSRRRCPFRCWFPGPIWP